MKSLHFAIGNRTKGTQKGAAHAHVRYIMRTPDQAADHAAYVTRSSGHVREDLVATGAGNLPDWAAGDPIAFFTEADRWERTRGRTATQITAALPRDLTHAQQQAAVDAFVTSQLGTKHAYVWGMHETVASDGGRYPHVHIAFSERQDSGRALPPQQYFSQAGNHKDRLFNDPQWPHTARQAWSDTLNVALEAAGSAERVSARSFRDQGLSQQPAAYIGREALKQGRRSLSEREPTSDTPEMLAKRTQEWEARKQVLGLTRGMDPSEMVQRIGDASRGRLTPALETPTPTQQRGQDVSPERLAPLQDAQRQGQGDQHVMGNRRSMIYHEPQQRNYGDIHPTNQVHFRSAQDAEAAGYRRARNAQEGDGTGIAQQLAHVRQLKQVEDHYTRHPGELRTPAHLAAVAQVLQDEGQPVGRSRVRAHVPERDDAQRRGRGQGRAW